jgi:hypothetical protein
MSVAAPANFNAEEADNLEDVRLFHPFSLRSSDSFSDPLAD